MTGPVEETHRHDSFGDADYDRAYAEGSERSMFRYRGFLEKLKALGIKGRYLEIGAGPGLLAAAIAEQHRDVRVTATDPSPEMVAIATKYIAGQGLEERVAVQVGDALDDSLPETLGTFNLVYCTYVLHHLDDPAHALHNMGRMVTDGGALLVYDLRPVWWLRWLPLENGFVTSVKQAFLKDEVTAFLREAGIERFEVRHEFPFIVSAIARKV
jgi:ubiquinone/menaquinone biosynthesis C-methylase UbiE